MKFNPDWLKPTFVPVAVDKHPNSDSEAPVESSETKEIQVTSGAASASDSSYDGVDENAQAGVQKIEATTSVWSKNQLILAYLLYVPTHFQSNDLIADRSKGSF